MHFGCANLGSSPSLAAIESLYRKVVIAMDDPKKPKKEEEDGDRGFFNVGKQGDTSEEDKEKIKEKIKSGGKKKEE